MAASTSAVVYFLFVLSMGNMPTFTGLSVYEDKGSCTAAADTMNAALAPDEKSVKMICLSSTDLKALGPAIGD